MVNLGLLSAAKMVQKKVASKLGIGAGSSKAKAKEEKEQSLKQAEGFAGQSKAGELQKIKLRKSRSRKLSHSDSLKLKKQFRWRNFTGSGSSSFSKKGGSRTRESKTPSPNYMNSTTSSIAKKEVVQVSPNPPTSSKCKSTSIDTKNSKHGLVMSSKKSPISMMRNSSLKPVGSLKKKNSIKGFFISKPNVGRATCSSTLRDTKFPAVLDLHPGDLEVERASVMKVCPYNYCSLNGSHQREPMPSLKRFVSIRRRMLKAQKSKGSSDAKVHPLEDDESDFFVEIYVQSVNEKTEEISASQEGHDEIELNLSEVSNTEKHFCVATVEESKIERLTSAEEVKEISFPISLYKSSEVDEEVEAEHKHQFEEVNQESEVVPTYCIEEDDQSKLQICDSQNKNPTQYELFPEPVINIEDQLCWAVGCGNILVEKSQILDTNHSSKALKKQDEDIDETSNPIIPRDNHHTETGNKFDVDEQAFIIQDVGDDGKGNNQKFEQKKILERVNGQADNINQMEIREVSILDEKLDSSDKEQALENVDNISSSVMKQKSTISRGTQTDSIEEEAIEEELKKMVVVPSKEHDIKFEQENHQFSQKLQQMKEAFYRKPRSIILREESILRDFNPRGPIFLRVEPNPERETVDLKHQLMDERRSQEEWMLDHALQQAVGKLISGARSGRRRVNLLVKAFETINPDSETTPFQHATLIQACR